MAGGNPLLNDFGKKNATTTAPGSYQDPRYSPEQLERMYSAPAAGPAQTGRMSYDDVVVRTSLVLGCVVAGVMAVLGVWQLRVYETQGAEASAARAAQPPVALASVAPAATRVAISAGLT